MLDKLSRQILKYCISRYDSKLDNSIKVTPSEFNVGCDIFNTAAKTLYKNDLIEPFTYAYSNSSNVEIRLTSKAIDFLQCEYRAKMFKLLHFLVAVATLIIALLQYLK